MSSYWSSSLIRLDASLGSTLPLLYGSEAWAIALSLGSDFTLECSAYSGVRECSLISGSGFTLRASTEVEAGRPPLILSNALLKLSDGTSTASWEASRLTRVTSGTESRWLPLTLVNASRKASDGPDGGSSLVEIGFVSAISVEAW
ncbi:hypothetical protein BD414DRAFT_474172 [Trametes punicea]|nr:hypothetical protein BD414DRAFT_474172 [Trametes punicea]